MQISLCIRQDFDIIRNRLPKEEATCPIPFIDEVNNGVIVSINYLLKKNAQKIMNILHQTEYGDYTIDLKDLDKIISEVEFPKWLKNYMIDYPEDEVYISFTSEEVEEWF